MKYKNITLIGTSHIAKQSIDDIKTGFEKLNPDIVALELDKRRLIALVSKHKTNNKTKTEKNNKDNKNIKNKRRKNKDSIPFSSIFKIGIKGFIFSLIGHWAEKKLGSIVGVSPGSDMLTAFHLARKNKRQIALIDQDIEITLKRLSKSITWKEKWQFVVDIFNGVVLRKREIEGFDLTTVPSKDLMKKMMTKVKKKYPNIYKVLVTERNKIMSRNLAILMKRNPDKKILAIVGAGHEKEMIQMIKDKVNKIEIV